MSTMTSSSILTVIGARAYTAKKIEVVMVVMPLSDAYLKSVRAWPAVRPNEAYQVPPWRGVSGTEKRAEIASC